MGCCYVGFLVDTSNWSWGGKSFADPGIYARFVATRSKRRKLKQCRGQHPLKSTWQCGREKAACGNWILRDNAGSRLRLEIAWILR
jgi:hypothetical protein